MVRGDQYDRSSARSTDHRTGRPGAAYDRAGRCSSALPAVARPRRRRFGGRSAQCDGQRRDERLDQIDDEHPAEHGHGIAVPMPRVSAVRVASHGRSQLRGRRTTSVPNRL